jgi:putative spermidine/putrescine transport system permease protein
MSGRIERLAWRLAAGGVLLFLFFPLLLVIVISFNPDGFVFPPSGVSLEWYASMLNDSALINAFLLSVGLGIGTAVITLPLVILASVGLRNEGLPGQQYLENVFLFPLMVPEVVLGFALLIYFSSLGLTGSTVGIVFGHIMFTTPFALQTILAAMKGIDTDIEDAAHDLGAGSLQTLAYVTLPMIKPAIIAGAGYVFILSFTNVTMTLFLVGSGTVTIPVEIYQYISFSIDPTVAAVGAVLIIVSTSVVVYMDRVFSVQEISGF